MAVSSFGMIVLQNLGPFRSAKSNVAPRRIALSRLAWRRLTSFILAPIVRKRAEKYYNVVHYNDYTEGGHFAVHERADEMAKDLRKFFRSLRDNFD